MANCAQPILFNDFAV